VAVSFRHSLAAAEFPLADHDEGISLRAIAQFSRATMTPALDEEDGARPSANMDVANEKPLKTLIFARD
jgi:hypothetical protein